jgi:hypothetical protein
MHLTFRILIKLSLFICFISCNNSKIVSPESEIIKEDETLEIELNVDEKFIEWEKCLITNSIFDYVTVEDCNDLVKINKLNNFGKYPTHAINKRLIKFNLNDDRIVDYIITYDLESCLDGINYSHDFIFVTSNSDSKLVINQELTNQLKFNFLKYSLKNFGNDSYLYMKGDFIYTKGIQIDSIMNGRLLGSFELQKNGADCCPEVSGNFEFDLHNYTLSTNNVLYNPNSKIELPN